MKKNLIIVMLVLALALMTWLAYYNSTIPPCDAVIDYADGSQHCVTPNTAIINP